MGVGKYYQVSLGRDVITIASALMPDGCDVIASLPVERVAQPYPRPSLPDTRYSILNTLTPLLHLRLAQASLSSSNAIGSAGGRSMDLRAKPGIMCRIQVNNIGMLCTTVKTKMDSRPSRNVCTSAMKKTR